MWFVSLFIVGPSTLRQVQGSGTLDLLKSKAAKLTALQKPFSSGIR
jgi:hypothetical protein